MSTITIGANTVPHPSNFCDDTYPEWLQVWSKYCCENPKVLSMYTFAFCMLRDSHSMESVERHFQRDLDKVRAHCPEAYIKYVERIVS